MVTALRPPEVAISSPVDPAPTTSTHANEPMLWLIAVFLRWLGLILGGIAVLAAVGLYLYRRWTT